MVGASLNWLGTPIKALKPIGALGSKPGSSIASYTLSKAIPITFTKVAGKKLGTKIATKVGTNVIGRFLGRLAPGVGWVLTIKDYSKLVYQSFERFQTLPINEQSHFVNSKMMLEADT